MNPNIMKFYLILNAASIALATRSTQVSTAILDGFADDLNIHPFVKVGSKLYYFGLDKVSWHKAFLICRSLGGFLASLKSAEELTVLSNYLIEKYPSQPWWLSGSDIDSEGDYYWYGTGERMTLTDWYPGQPDNYKDAENCVELIFNKSKYQMNDWRCNGTTSFICETEKPKTIVVSVF